MEKIHEQLESLGMSPNEAKVYTASLELGPATAQQIAAKAAVVRPTAYVAIGGLVKRGLMSQFKKGKKVNFQAEKRSLEEREARLDKALPYLKSLITLSNDKPEVKFFEGLDGLDAMRDVLLSSKAKEMDVISTTQYDKIVSQASIEAFEERFSKAGITARSIKFSDNPKRKTVLSETGAVGTSKRVRKFIYSDAPGDFAEIALFQNYVSIIVYGDKPYGFLIQSKPVANTMKMMFEAFWKALPK